jgi:hypothetical protein
VVGRRAREVAPWQARSTSARAQAVAATPPTVKAEEDEVVNDRSFFVSESGRVTQPPEVAGWESDDGTTPTAPAWGYDKRSCAVCGSDWGLTGCSKSGCASVEFITTVIPPVPFTTRVMDKLRPKKAAARASAAQVEHICALRAGVTALLADLRALDAELRDAVVDGVVELQPLQGLLNRALARYGDRGLASVDGCSLSLESFVAYLDIYVKQIGDTP